MRPSVLISQRKPPPGPASIVRVRVVRSNTNSRSGADGAAESVVTDATYQTMTSIDVSQGAFGPVNQFNNVRSPNGSGSTTVVAPGATSLSSIAWVDLQDEPQVLHVPQVTGHSFVLALLDPYTTNLRNLGNASSTAPGDYVLVDPAHVGVEIPRGAHEIDVDYSRIWIIGSTQLKGASDIATVNKIQDGYTLTPLSKVGTDYLAPTPVNPATTVMQHGVPSGLAFFDQLGAELEAFPPPAADSPALASFATVGIGPGMTPSTDRSLSADTVQGLIDAVSAGPAQIKTDTAQLFAEDFPKHQGYLLGGFGSYGTNYAERAVISQIGLGAFVPQQAIYAMTWTDHAQQQITALLRQRHHIGPRDDDDFQVRNLEEIAQRERESGPPARAAEAGRLAALLGHAGSFDELQSELCRRLATGAIDEHDAGLMAHLRATVMAQVAIDSPRYWSFVAAQRRGGR